MSTSLIRDGIFHFLLPFLLYLAFLRWLCVSLAFGVGQSELGEGTHWSREKASEITICLHVPMQTEGRICRLGQKASCFH